MTVTIEASRLSALAKRVDGRVVGGTDSCVTGVSHDSRRVRPGDLFAAIAGFETDGHRFIHSAAEAGATAALVEREGPWPVPVIVVDDVRRAIGPVAHAIAGDPTTRMRVIGITGTNGKTTTTFMTAAVLGDDEAATLGTLGVRRRGRVIKTGLTTPEAPELARLFADLKQEGVTSVVMEVSSHAIALGRIGGIHFAAGAFTNLSPDHLDFHPTMEEYGEAKLDFFRLLREQHGFGAVNADDAWGERFRVAGPAGTWRFSARDSAAEVYAERVDVERDGTTMDVRTPRGRFTTRLPMAGRFNAANALAAAALGVGLGDRAGGSGSRSGCGRPCAWSLRGLPRDGHHRNRGLRPYPAGDGTHSAGRARYRSPADLVRIRLRRRARSHQATEDGRGGRNVGGHCDSDD
ncbi:MAG: hypothetical protein KAI97_04465 [Gemmatimonadetes bacterium]|nr:hypothetical protein [Gemmatimonadota bacterium]